MTYRHDRSLTIADVWAAGVQIDGVLSGWSKRLLREVFDVEKVDELPRHQWEEFYDTCKAEIAERRRLDNNQTKT